MITWYQIIDIMNLNITIIINKSIKILECISKDIIKYKLNKIIK